MARVLVVDDDQAVAQSIADILEYGGHEAILARQGRAALEDVEILAYDMVITDVVMPQISGWEVIRTVHQKRPDVRIVAISGGGGAFPAETALRVSRGLGALAVVPKPIELEVLLRLIEVAMRPVRGVGSSPQRQ